MTISLSPKTPQPDSSKHELPLLHHLAWTTCIALVYVSLCYAGFRQWAFIVTMTAAMAVIQGTKLVLKEFRAWIPIGTALCISFITLLYLNGSVMSVVHGGRPTTAVIPYEYILKVGMGGTIFAWLLFVMFYWTRHLALTKRDAYVMAIQTLAFYLLFALLPYFLP